MSEATRLRGARFAALRWLLWAGFAVLWTVSLMTTYPLAVRDAVVPPRWAFTSGKSLHVAAYAVFALLTGWLPVTLRWRWALLAGVSLHALITEFFQEFVARTPSWGDVGLDHAGIALGVLLSWKRWARPKSVEP